MKRAILYAILGIIFLLCISSFAFCANIEVTLEDAAGSNAFSVKDSNTNEVAYIDSRGNMMVKGGIQTFSTDFYDVESGYTNPPWYREPISSGTATTQTGSASHPGIVRIISSTTAYSGYWFEASSGAGVLLIAGSEYSEFVFQVITTSGTTVRLGFQDSITTADPTDGVWINISGTTLTGKAKKNVIPPSTTGTSYTIDASTWYRGVIAVNSGATRVDFYLYYGIVNGNQLWTDNVQANIPTASGRETSHGVVATNSGTTATALIDLDYMNLAICRRLTR